MAKHLLPLLCLVAACSPTLPKDQCTEDADCGESLMCSDGTCVAQTDTGCHSDETLPCGPAAVGVCHPGVFRCIDGVFETTCFGEATGSAETCNGIDDDCDGTVDDGVIKTFYIDLDGDGFGSSASGAEKRQACTKPSGFADNASDCDDANGSRKPTAQEICDPSGVDENCDGTANENCGCTNPGMMQACCSGRGFQTCDAHDGGATLSMCSVQPSVELCNGVDDDCDGMTDELFTTIADDGGVPMLDAGTVLPDGTCTIGVGACARTAGVACVMGSLSCLAVEGTPSAETCNNIDDDCDGQTDEASPGLCSVTGQTCSAGSCVCPSGQTVCGGSCQTLGGSCSAGVGACARTGAMVCVRGGVECDAVPGASAPETCDGIDNDCDGTVDNGVTIVCNVDADNDRVALSSATSNQCRDSSRSAFGFCPVGYVAPGSSTGLDCNDSNPTVYQLATTMADADNDQRCTGQTANECIGAVPPAGRRLATSCVSSSDCDDTNTNIWMLNQTRADGDNDGYCLGTAASTCTGNTAPAGRRFVNNCVIAPDDCDDTSAARFTSRQVRVDADNDGYCIGNVLTQCGGSAPSAGTRVSSTCNTTIDDCKDTNGLANTVCSISRGYRTASQTKQCGIGFPGVENYLLNPAQFCPPGFSRSGPPLPTRTAGDPAASCSASTDVNLSMSCNSLVFGSFTCEIQGDCVAN